MIALPKGTLREDPDGLLVLRLRASRPARREMRDWYDRLAEARPQGVLAPRRLVDGQHGFEVHFDEGTRDTVNLAAAVAQIRQDLQGAVPVILDLGRFVFETASELAGADLGDALVAPITLRVVVGTPSPWRLLPLPARGHSVADWARAAPDAWLWSTSETVLTGAPCDPVHTLGAALHTALTGTVIPETLPSREAFTRLLRGRTGLAARLGAAVRDALPRTLDDDAVTLERFILDCLEPLSDRRPPPPLARSRLDELTTALAIDRLIRYWGFENRPDIVARLTVLKGHPSGAEPGSPDVPARGGTPARVPTPGSPTTPAQTKPVPWDEQVPRLVEQGNLAGALEAAWNDLQENGPARARFYLAVVQRIAASRPGPSTEVTAALDRLSAAFGGKLDESDVLRIAHIRLRHLGEPSDRLGIAHRKFASRWNDATARLIQARLTLIQGQAANQVSRLCREARGIYDTMPEKGGRAGTYATAYLHLLDGIAHIGAVSQFRDSSFYAAAFEHFGRALELAGRSGGDDVVRSCLGWLAWMGRLTRPTGDPSLSLLSAGIDGILGAHGLTPDAVPTRVVPEIPWYNEAQLFPV